MLKVLTVSKPDCLAMVQKSLFGKAGVIRPFNGQIGKITAMINKLFAILLLLLCTALAGCMHYTPEEQAYYKNVRCQWVMRGSDMPGEDECRDLP